MRTSIVCLALAMACAPKKAPETPVDHPAAVVVAKKSLEQLVSSAAILLEGDVSIADAESATALMDEATKRFPDAAVAHYNLGVARYHADDLAGAQRAFERAKGLDDELAEVWLQLGRTLAARGDFGGAIGTFRSAVGRFPEDIAIRVALIDAYRQQGRPDQAIDEAKSALKVRADSVELYNSLGLAYLDTNQLSLARFVFQKALAAVEGAEDNAYLNCNLGRV
ncbi:MAG: tetratricopeptide (TPR) repeat protein, partial [Myxococcota bacterium]